MVSIDRLKTSHNSLQYNVDKYAQFSPDGIVKFTHNGKIMPFCEKRCEEISEIKFVFKCVII